MQKKYSIYFQKKLVIIDCLSNQNGTPDIEFNQSISIEILLDKITQFADTANKDSFFISTSKPTELYRNLSQHFTLVPAAGGIVLNADNSVLLIWRRGYMDLPKGKIDAGETPEQAALREVEEECGVDNLNIVKELPSTFHTYKENEKHILKQTYWYEMRTTQTAALVPQAEEGITEAKWVAKEEIPSLLKQTYPSLRTLLSDYLHNIEEK